MSNDELEVSSFYHALITDAPDIMRDILRALRDDSILTKEERQHVLSALSKIIENRSELN